MTVQKRYRVAVDFQELEREMLAVLCNKDYRTPEDQLRFLVVTEAQRRGLARNEHNGAGSTFSTSETGAVVTHAG